MPDKLPQEIINHWPEVFEDIEIKAVPIEYLNSAVVYFDNGDVWEIDIKGPEFDDAEESLNAFFEEYDEAIVKVDFKIDSERVVKDVKSKVKSFIKKRK